MKLVTPANYFGAMDGRAPKNRRKRAASRVSCFRASSCSQMRSTRQPPLRSILVTSRSRLVFAANFFRQNAALFRGFVACRGQPCQKQPSTKTACLSLGKTKSGRTRKSAPFPLWEEGRGEVLRLLTLTSTCLLHPEMPCARKTRTKASSVRAFPRERMRDITSLRLALVKTSGTEFF